MLPSESVITSSRAYQVIHCHDSPTKGSECDSYCTRPSKNYIPILSISEHSYSYTLFSKENLPRDKTEMKS